MFLATFSSFALCNIVLSHELFGLVWTTINFAGLILGFLTVTYPLAHWLVHSNKIQTLDGTEWEQKP